MQSNKDGQKVMSWYSHRSHCVEDELTFWKNLSSGKKTDHYYLGDVEFCKNLRIYEIDKHIKPFQQLERMSMLDLGSGPASVLSNYATDKISVIPVDVLAHEYMQISVAENLIRPIAVAGEKLSEFFPDEYFHVVFTSNALDHMTHPWHVVQNCFHILKEGGVFCIRSFVREADRQKYSGLHQHNLVLTTDGVIEENTRINLTEGTSFEMIESVEYSDHESFMAIFVKQ